MFCAQFYLLKFTTIPILPLLKFKQPQKNERNNLKVRIFFSTYFFGIQVYFYIEMEQHLTTVNIQTPCFNNYIEGYAPKKTVQYNQLINPFPLLPKDHDIFKSEIENKTGNKFGRSERVSPFKSLSNTPAATSYFPSAKAKPDPKKVKGHAFELKISRFEPVKQCKVRQSQNIDTMTNDRTLKQSYSMRMSEKHSFFDHVKFQKINIPAVGSYDVTKKDTKSHSLTKGTSSFKQTSLNKEQRQKTKLHRDRKWSPSPCHYNVKRSSSTGSLIYKKSCIEKDSKMKELLREHRKQKQKRNHTGPGKYLKIDNWASRKEYHNGFQSKGPKLKIYN